MWDMRRTVPVERVAADAHRRGVPLRRRARRLRRWWLVVADGEVDVCDFDPGYE